VGKLIEVRVPDIGDFEDVDVVEVFVQPGTHVEPEQSLITIESEKASLEIPSPSAGVVKDVKVVIGDKVSEGSLIVTLEADDGAQSASAEKREPAAKEESLKVEKPRNEQVEKATREEESKAYREEPPRGAPGRGAATNLISEDMSDDAQPADDESAPTRRAAPASPPPESESPIHASPSVRRFARELGVELRKVEGTGPKDRILKEDVQGYVKRRVAERVEGSGGFSLPPLPKADFAKFGEIEIVPLSKINILTRRNVHRSWLHIPHVTQFDEADITDLEEFRKANQPAGKAFKLTLLAFLLKACAGTLKSFPRFNASLDESGENLVLKHYFHIGVAVDTPKGLVVPVVRDVDSKGIVELAEQLAAISARARDGKLTPKDIQGATFTISSLGGIGGTAFTPIINAPEVAILGVARAAQKPIYLDDELVPRLILPLCLSYDHRVIDGAAAARFTTHLASLLGDIRRLAL
jgi:pyruvate dehydrogenase E2 component (dihydrolipoamide acetyltransferase)